MYSLKVSKVMEAKSMDKIKEDYEQVGSVYISVILRGGGGGASVFLLLFFQPINYIKRSTRKRVFHIRTAKTQISLWFYAVGLSDHIV